MATCATHAVNRTAATRRTAMGRVAADDVLRVAAALYIGMPTAAIRCTGVAPCTTMAPPPPHTYHARCEQARPMTWGAHDGTHVCVCARARRLLPAPSHEWCVAAAHPLARKRCRWPARTHCSEHLDANNVSQPHALAFVRHGTAGGGEPATPPVGPTPMRRRRRSRTPLTFAIHRLSSPLTHLKYRAFRNNRFASR